MIQSSDVGAYATGHKLDHLGVSYEFRHITDAELAEYERLNFKAKRDALAALRDMYPPEEYLKRVDRLHEDYKRSAFGLEADADFRQSRQGVMTLLGLIIRVDGKPASLRHLARLLQERKEDTEMLLKVILEESFGVKQEAAPEAGPAGGEEAPKKGISEPVSDR